MSPTERAAWRTIAAAYPPGSAVPVLREHLLDVLQDDASAPSAPLAGDLTCATAGGIIGRHASTLRGMCARGELPGAYRQHGREWRIPAGALATYRAQQAVPSTPRVRAYRAVPDLSAWRQHLPKSA